MVRAFLVQQRRFRYLHRTTLARILPFLILPLLLAGFLALSFLRLWGLRTPLTDDAFIFMRYANHIAGGQGFVWNRDQPPVEGFTSFLYQMFVAGLVWLDLSPVVLTPWLGLGFALLALGLTWWLARWLNPGHAVGNLLVLSLLCLSPSLIIWATSGMETLVYTCLLLAGVLSYIAYRHDRFPAWGVGLAYGLAVLARPEALLIFGATLCFEGTYRIYRREKPIFRAVMVMAATFLAVYLPYLLWRWIYFGDLLPNTYYAKTGAGLIQLQGGLAYLQQSLRFTFGGLAAVLAVGLLFVGWRRPDRWEPLYLLVVILVSWATIVINGGDHFPGGRFMLPVLPLLFVLIGLGLTNIFDKFARAGWLKAAAATVLLAIVLAQWSGSGVYKPAITGWQNLRAGSRPDIPTADPSQMAIFKDWVAGYMVMGQVIGAIAPPDASVAAVPIGAIGYYSSLSVIDMVGLTEPVIAHQSFDPAYIESWRPGHDKGDGAYVLSRRPTYIQLTDYLTSQPWSGPGDGALEYKSIAEIWASPDFHAHYEFYPLQVDGGWYYNLYRRVDRPEARPPRFDIAKQVSLSEAGRYQTDEHLFLQLNWQAQQLIGQDYTIFVHLVDKDGRRVSGQDILPQQSFLALTPGETMRTQHMIPLQPDVADGNYALLVGLYYFKDATHQQLENVGQVNLAGKVIIE